MIAAHFHDEHELYVLESGKAQYLIGSEIYRLEPGDFLFVPKGVFHLTEYGEGEQISRVLFTFDDRFVGEAYQAYVEEMKADLHGSIQPKHLPEVMALVARVEQECNTYASADMQRLYLCQLLMLLSRYRQRKTETSGNGWIVQDAARFISAHYAEPLTLDRIAARYALSPGYFSKLFKKGTGAGVNEYLNLSRVTAAQQMLKTTRESVTEIALKCGFNDSNYFARIFQKLVGTTPKKYALQNRASKNASDLP